MKILQVLIGIKLLWDSHPIPISLAVYPRKMQMLHFGKSILLNSIAGKVKAMHYYSCNKANVVLITGFVVIMKLLFHLKRVTLWRYDFEETADVIKLAFRLATHS